jgi:hypothetical protein
MEACRTELITRLQSLGEPARHYPGYRGARKLLNDIYRKQRVAKRLAVLDAASWLVAVLEELTPLVWSKRPINSAISGTMDWEKLIVSIQHISRTHPTTGCRDSSRIVGR